jgi:4-hydroxy-tetrahydrodipicolinate synthase
LTLSRASGEGSHDLWHPRLFGPLQCPAAQTVSQVQHEDWPGLGKISTLRGYESRGEMRPISILCGNGGLFLDFEVERGADGAMTGYCFPEMLTDLVDLTRSGDRDGAHDVFDAHLPLVRYEQQQNIGLAVRKHVLHRRGILNTDALRSPGTRLSEHDRAEINYLLTRLAARDTRVKLVR